MYGLIRVRGHDLGVSDVKRLAVGVVNQEWETVEAKITTNALSW